MQATARSSPFAAGLLGASYQSGRCFHRNGRHSLHRAYDLRRRRRVVIKATVGTPSPPEGLLALRHEFEVLRRLKAPNIAHALELETFDGALAMVLDDAGAHDLRHVLRSGRVSLSVFFGIASQLVDLLDTLGRHGLMHRDLSPANLVVDGSGHLTLVDFELATDLESLTPAADELLETVGTLAYMSPERSGRTGRKVDYRSDIYSVGAIYYHLLTGNPPFVTDDPVEMIYAHLARRAVPAHEVDSHIPEPLSAICTKLLEKEPESRYQTAWALRKDLAEAERHWRSQGRIAPFPLAREDVRETLHLTDKLYGRSQELESLRSLFGEANAGHRRLVLIRGPAGIGKSALVERLEPDVIGLRGYFLRGKFNQLRRGQPFATVIEAFDRLARQLLTLPEEQLARWREQLSRALGVAGRALVELIPALRSILGELPELSNLPADAARNRFTKALLAFVHVCASEEHPLLLFLDDLQWADAESLRLLERLLTDPETRHLLLVLAYREEAVGPDHPLRLLLRTTHDSGVDPRSVALGPLTERDIAELLHDALAAPLRSVEPLAVALAFSSGGNPFALRRILRDLADERLLYFDRERRSWKWELEKIRSRGPARTGAEMLLPTLERLREQTRDLLTIAACVGDAAPLSLIADCAGRSVAETAEALWPAVRAGLLSPLGEAYRLPQEGLRDDSQLGQVTAIYRFVHDRIRATAYRRFDVQKRTSIHLTLGRLLQRSPDALTSFKAADHLNRAIELIEDPVERLDLARLDLQVGQGAKAATAYSNALRYFTLGMRCLPPDERAWRDHADLTFALFRERAECAYLTGEHELAERLMKRALAHVGRGRRAELASVRIVAATLAGKYAHAVAVGAEVLAQFDIPLPRDGVEDATRVQLERVHSLLANVTAEEMLGAPRAKQTQHLQAMEILANLLAPVFLGERALLGYVAGKMVELSLLNGHSLHSSEAYAAFAFVHGAATGDHTREHEIGRVGVELARRYGSGPELCRTLYIFGNHSNHWHDAVATDLPLLRESFRVGIESGELHYAVYALSGILHASAALGRPLDELLSEAEECEKFARRAGQPTTVHVSAMYRIHCRALQGCVDADDASWANHCRAAPDATALCQAHIRTLQRGFLLGDTESARRAASQAAPLLGAILGMIPTAEYHFYAGLLATSVVRRSARKSEPADAGGAEETGRACAGARLQLRELTRLAAHCPRNFLHRQMLVQAELDRLEGRNWQAVRLYAGAAERARVQGFEVDRAIADELAGRFFYDHEEWRYAAVHLQAAYRAYRSWGATAKLRRLEESYAHLLEATPGQPEDGSSSGVRCVDTAELLRASQAISGQLAFPDLLRTLLEIILRVAGAERAYLLLERDGTLYLRAKGPARGRGVALVRQDVRTRRELPQGILEFVHRSKETVLLGDAAGGGMFTEDPAVRRRRIRSVLCAPILRQDQAVGLLYLENNLTPYAFTPARLETLRHLAAQAAISLENSALVEALRRNQELYSTLAKHFPGGAVYLFDRNLRILVAEGLGLAEAGLEGATMVGQVPTDVFGAEAGRQVEALMRVALGGVEASDEIVYRGRVYQVQMAPIHDQRGQVVLGMAMSLDVTQRKLDEEQLRLAAKVFESSAEAVVITDAERRVVLVNRSFGLLTGFEPREVIGRESDLLHPEDPHAHRLLWDSMLRHGHWQGEFWYRHKSGARVPLWFALTAVHDPEGRLTHYVCIFSDISERKAAEERIQFLAYYDGLTRLPNRTLLHERLRLALALAEREGRRVAVLFLDLDRFKHVNDSLGHAAGDRLLQEVAKRLQRVVREEDTMSRFGGDEFVIALSDLEEPLDAGHAAEKILAAFKRPFFVDEQEIRTSTSIGISLYPDDAVTPDTLIKHADVAMYHAKAHGRNKYQYFTVELNARASERLFIESALARAVSEGELALHYQAQVDVKSGRVIAAEALMRWYHPERGLILPGHFVPLAEETGQVVELGEWALRTACNQNRAWQRAGLPPITVAVNLAAEHFRQQNFTGSLAAILEQSTLSPQWLELELTERTVMANPEATAGTLRALKATGVQVSIDDFGTGYSSLAYLKSFSIDKLKIDQSFVRDVAECSDDAVITRSIITLGHNLRLQVVAEGVETPQHLAFLREEDCDAVQGFYLSRPLPAPEFAQWLGNSKCAASLTPPH